MMNKKNLTIIGLVVVVLGVAGGLIYRDMRSSQKIGETNDAGVTTNVSGIDMIGKGSVQIIPLDNQKLAAAPSLDRTTDFKNTLTPEVKAIVVARLEANVTALKKDPQNVSEWIMLGLNRKTLGDYEGARDAWEYVKMLTPSDIVAWNNLGDLYHYYLKDYVKSEENWKKTIALKPDYVQGYSGLVDLYKYSLKEKMSETPIVLKGGIAKNPDVVDLRVMLAHYYVDVGQTANAKDAYNNAIATAKRIKNSNLAGLLQAELTGLK